MAQGGRLLSPITSADMKSGLAGLVGPGGGDSSNRWGLGLGTLHDTSSLSSGL